MILYRTGQGWIRVGRAERVPLAVGEVRTLLFPNAGEVDHTRRCRSLAVAVHDMGLSP